MLAYLKLILVIILKVHYVLAFKPDQDKAQPSVNCDGAASLGEAYA